MIYFCVWAPDEATFWQSWIGAGICDAERNFLAPYAGCIEVTTSWPGMVEKDGEAVPGWHCNVRVCGDLEAQFTAGLPQTDEHGNLLKVWQRTHAIQAFGLTYHEADPETGFPAGYRSSGGVAYADTADFSSPSNVWAS